MKSSLSAYRTFAELEPVFGARYLLLDCQCRVEEIAILLNYRQDLCQEWANKPKEEQTFEGFHRAVSAAAAHQYGRTKYKVNTLMVVSQSDDLVTN